MDSYPYVQSPVRLAAFLKRLSEIGKPARFTNEALRALGYTSSNDRAFLRVIRHIGLVGPLGEPTPLWDEMRADLGRAIGAGVRAGYAELFRQYPDAYRRDDEALRAFFAARTPVGAAAVSKTVATFRALCRLAAFPDSETDMPKEETPSRRGPAWRTTSESGLQVTVNLHLTLPADASAQTCERLFRALRRHLLDGDG